MPHFRIFVVDFNRNLNIHLQLVTAEEAKEGVDARMDRRSLKRLLARLSNEGQLKNMRIVLRYNQFFLVSYFIIFDFFFT